MNIKEFTKLASRTDAPIKEMNVDPHSVHMVLGMVTEVAEIADIYKKKIAYGKEIDEINEKEEIGDLMWYVARHCKNKGWDLGEILDTNIKKLQSRYPEKFTNDKAMNRDLDKERKILERKPGKSDL